MKDIKGQEIEKGDVLFIATMAYRTPILSRFEVLEIIEGNAPKLKVRDLNTKRKVTFSGTAYTDSLSSRVIKE